MGFCSTGKPNSCQNFLLAIPALSMVFYHTYNFLNSHWDYVKRMGLVDNNLLGMPRKPCLEVRQHKVLPRESFVYVVHATALGIFALFFMHVQVVTRFLMASSPILPWLASIMTTRRGKEGVPLCEDNSQEVLMKIECKSNLLSNTDTILFQEKLDTDMARWVMMFFLGYTLVGTILFCNHLPWT